MRVMSSFCVVAATEKLQLV
uniref:Uncharacterized protein n=1 Tax=Anguilla anguilla TaxID=7936 RepID=A0A0E9UX03_ANGAN